MNELTVALTMCKMATSRPRVFERECTCVITSHIHTCIDLSSTSFCTDEMLTIQCGISMLNSIETSTFGFFLILSATVGFTFRQFFMVALCNRADHYIFILFLLLLLSSFFPRLISAVGDWMFTILWHMVWP